MALVDSLTVEQIKSVLFAFNETLVTHCESINALNVYPVPDGDTGTNMSFTLRSVIAELDNADGSPESYWNAIRHGSLMGARGNSGVILSQILRGLADSFSEEEKIDQAAITRAFSRASEAAYESVLKPVEGTILTVAREIAEKAENILHEDISLADYLKQLVTEGERSLEGTPDLLPVLRDAGVVDAGGAGYLLLVQSFLLVVDGTPISPPMQATARIGRIKNAEGALNHDAVDVSELRYEVMFFLDAPDENIEGFKADWSAIGDSIVVVGGDGIWNCHIHSNDIGASIEAGIRAGRPHQIRVTDLQEELFHNEDHIEIGGISQISVPNPNTETCAVIAVVAGEGIQKIFASMGVNAIVRGGQSMNPSVRDLLDAVQQVNAEEILILPNNKNIIPVSEQVNEQVEKNVCIVPTRSIPEGFSSLLAFDPKADAETNAEAMTALASTVVTGEVTQAVRDSDTGSGAVKEGDWIGLDRSGVVVSSDSLLTTTQELLSSLIADSHEIVTVISGDGSSEEITKAIEEWIAVEAPQIEIEVHQGGQPLYPYYFGIE
ncbi:MAG: DAK2 domain-containing protein [Actinomycetota bacterium]|nr:DAK2 domain-containing protein [Actinomycetota bacterium]